MSQPQDLALIRARFAEWLERLRRSAEAAPDVIGLVGMGSTAEQQRVDQWSDHDFAWITRPGAEARYRDAVDWLPDHEQLALTVIEHHGGGKAIYRDGRIIEYGITDLAGLAGWSANAYLVLYDAGGVAETMRGIANRPAPEHDQDGLRSIRLLLTQLAIGTGRARRGELLSAGSLIRDEAAVQLLRAVAARHGGDARLDSLDPRRRVESVHPALAAELAAAQALEPEAAARAILSLAERALGRDWSGFPHEAAALLRRRFGWPAG